MRDRADLSKVLHELCDNVYFNSPSNVTMNYPCIRYSFDGDSHVRADDIRYINYGRYQLIHIYKSVSNRLYEEILGAFRYISFDRQYVSDGLYHDVYTLYF